MVPYGSGCGTGSKWPFIAYKWVILTTETNWEPILQVFSRCEPGLGQDRQQNSEAEINSLHPPKFNSEFAPWK